MLPASVLKTPRPSASIMQGWSCRRGVRASTCACDTVRFGLAFGAANVMALACMAGAHYTWTAARFCTNGSCCRRMRPTAVAEGGMTAMARAPCRSADPIEGPQRALRDTCGVVQGRVRVARVMPRVCSVVRRKTRARPWGQSVGGADLGPRRWRDRLAACLAALAANGRVR